MTVATNGARLRFTIVRADTVYEGWGKLIVVTLRDAEGNLFTRQVDDHGSGVCVLPYDPERRVATLVSQFRTAMFYSGSDPFVLEVPCGRLDSRDPATCVRREAIEETGLRLDHLDFVCEFWVAPGGSTERLSLFLAPHDGSGRIAEGGGIAEENEHIQVHEVALSELARMADNGTLVDLKTFAAVQALRLRRPDLFL